MNVNGPPRPTRPAALLRAAGQRGLAAVLLAVLAVTTSGCYTRVVRVPGVIDLRSDGHALDKAPPSPVQTREGLDALVSGAGLSYEGDRITIEERQAWALGFFSVWNASATEELEAALAPTKMLSDVVVEERVTWVDVSLYATKLIPVVNLVGLWATPTITAYLSGVQRVSRLPARVVDDGASDGAEMFPAERITGDDR